MSVAVARPNAITEIFGRTRVVIGMIHCRPLPGTPNYDGEPVGTIFDHALRDADAYAEARVDGLIVENHGDIPFLKPDAIGPETAAVLAVITDRLRQAVGLPLGVNVLANAAIPALAVALAGGARFIRVNQWANAYVANEGIVEGEAARALRYRATIAARHIRVFADAHVKHGAHAIVADRPIAELARDVEFFHADAVIATGQRTGDAAAEAEIAALAEATSLPLLVGSGVTEENINAVLPRVDGVIVASSLKQGGVWWNPVDPIRVGRFMQRVRELRGG